MATVYTELPPRKLTIGATLLPCRHPAQTSYRDNNSEAGADTRTSGVRLRAPTQQ